MLLITNHKDVNIVFALIMHFFDHFIHYENLLTLIFFGRSISPLDETAQPKMIEVLNGSNRNLYKLNVDFATDKYRSFF